MIRQIKRRQVMAGRKAHNDSMKAEYKRYAETERKENREPLPRRYWEADRARAR